MHTGKYTSILAFCGVLAMGGLANAASIVIGDLRCEYLANPLGIDETKPRLSWILQSGERGQTQTAYQILVASNPAVLNEHKGDLWDSGKVDSNKSIHIEYVGTPLQSEMKCFWKVRVWDKDGQPSDWSETALWSMGLLGSTDWKAQWVGLDRGNKEVISEATPPLASAAWIWYPTSEPAQSAPVETIYFRRTIAFSADAKAKQVLCSFAADNSFTLWVNGEQIGQGNNFKQIGQFDVTKLIVPGDNVFCLSAVNSGPSENPAGLIGCIQITGADGQITKIVTDESWKTSRQEEANWLTKEFDSSAWLAVKPLGAYGMAPWGDLQGPDLEVQSRRLPARYLRKEFSVGNTIKQAMVYVCGLGLFELQMNGQKIGDRVLEPGLTEYEKRVFYETFDVTQKLAAGQNAIGVILGNGRYYAPRLKTPTLTKDFGYPKLLLQLNIEYADGSHQFVVSDASWKITTEGPIRANNEYDGEEYDARMEMPGWSMPGFDESKWESVQMVQAPQGGLRAQMINPIKITETIQPIAVTNPQPGMYVFDMGQNMVGWCRLTVAGATGVQVKLRFAETLKKDGTIYLDNIRGAKVTDLYTLKGDGKEIYEPRFTYHGFRYVEVTGYPGTPDLSSILGFVVHDDVEQVGEFACSNPLLNQIRKNIFWGVRGNYRSFPTDCPQRDERQAWLGDRSAESRGETYLFNIAALYAKWMADIHDAQNDQGAVPCVAPTYWPMFPNDVTWSSCFTITPSTLYDQYADVRVLEKRYPGMKKWIEFMNQFLENGIMPRDTFGDWCVPPESPELIHSQDPGRQTAKPVLGTTYFYKNLCLLARYATILGKTEDAQKFQSQADEIKKAFNEKFFDKEKCQYDNGSQTSYVLPLAFGMVPGEFKAKVFENLVTKILNETNGHIGTGLIGGQWLMRVLSDNGRPDVAYTIASQKTYPSWGYMIDKGATTIWELWNGDTADPAMNSGNHIMLVGDLNIWMNEYLAGIQADSENPAFKHIIMRPVPVGDLTACRASYKSLHGTIVSDWKIEGGQFIWTVQVPVNTMATVFVPTKDEVSVQESGKPLAEAAGVKLIRMEEGRAVVETQSGQYRFTSKIQ